MYVLNTRCSFIVFILGLAIPENDLSTSIAVTSGGQGLKNGSTTETTKQKTVLSTPPWKGGHSEGQSSSISKYSPAFKRKPFTVYSTGNVKPPTSRQNSQSISPQEGQSNNGKRVASSSTGMPSNQLVSKPISSTNLLPTGRQASVNGNKRSSKEGLEKPITNTSRKSYSAIVNKIDIDSDNDSAVSSARSSLSHSSGSACVSPPSSPPLGNCGAQEGESSSEGRKDDQKLSYSETSKDTEVARTKNESRKPSSATNPGNDMSTSNQSSADKNPRVLKRHSVEAINRRNILESCKKSSAKDTVLVPPPEGKIIITESSEIAKGLNASSGSVQKAVNNSKHEKNPTNTCRTTTPIAKERRSISSSSRATSFPLGKFIINS